MFHRLKLLAARRLVAAAFKGSRKSNRPMSSNKAFNDGMFPDDVTLQVASYLRKYPWVFFDFKSHFLPKQTTSDEEYVEVLSSRIAWFQRATPVLEEVIKGNFDVTDQVDRFGEYRKLGIVSDLYDHLRIRNGLALDLEHHRALLTAATLLQGGLPYNDPWFIDAIIEHPSDVRKHAEALKQRQERWQWLVEDKLGPINYHAVTYSDGLIDMLAELRKTNHYVFSDITGLIDGKASEPAVKDTIYFTHATGYDVADADDAIQGLHSYRELPSYTTYSEAPEEVRYQCIALVKVGVALRHANAIANIDDGIINQFYTIKDERIVKLILDHPERADMITTAIYDRNVTDFETISEATSSVISAGVL